MTTGNLSMGRRYKHYVYSNDYVNGYAAGFLGTTYQKQWVGDDYPKSNVRKKPFFAWSRGSAGAAYKQRPYPPRRQDMVPHSYNMTAMTLSIGDLSLFKEYGVNEEPPKKWSGYGDLQLPAQTQTGAADFWYYLGGNAWTEDDTSKLIDKLRESLAGSDFNPAVFLAEMPQCLRMIGDSATALAKAIRAFRKGNFRAAAQALSDYNGFPVTASNKWLELQYGWLPLLSDAEGAARFMARQLSQPVARVTARRTLPHFTNHPNGLVLAATNYTGNATWRNYFSNSQGVNSRTYTAYLKAVDKLTLSGLLAPETVAWELVPFSFVVDWFIPIGTFLEQSAFDRAVTATYVRSDFVHYTATGPYTVDITAGQNRVVQNMPGAGASDYLSGTRNARTISYSLPIRRPAFRGLQGVSLNRALNALALLGQSIK